MSSTLALSLAAAFALVLVAVAASLLRRRNTEQRDESLRLLLDLADQLESDLKTCRSNLKQAHAVMSMHPDLPAAGEQEARQAVDAGLRALLQQRLWIRDCLPDASQQAVDEAAASMMQARQRLQPLLYALERAQHELDDAMREHIKSEPHP